MSWVSQTFTSTIGRKLLVAATGLFLISFLIIHLIGNLQLFKGDDGLAFNAYAVFMTSNPLIKTVSYLLYFSILAHAVIAIYLWFVNRKARGSERYKVSNANENSSWISRSMALLGILVFAFIFMHLKDFWYYYKFGGLEFEIDANGYRDLYALVAEQFKSTFSLVAYLVGLVALALHLVHGFQSAFQTFGLNPQKTAKQVTAWFSIILVLGFATMPVYFYFFA
jgi:succinate dehydrogenase / fumarate reductase cytochrome b subunit